MYFEENYKEKIEEIYANILEVFEAYKKIQECQDYIASYWH